MCEYQREINIPDQKKTITEAQVIISVMSHEVLQPVTCIKNLNVLVKMDSQFTLLKNNERNFQSCYHNCF